MSDEVERASHATLAAIRQALFERRDLSQADHAASACVQAAAALELALADSTAQERCVFLLCEYFSALRDAHLWSFAPGFSLDAVNRELQKQFGPGTAASATAVGPPVPGMFDNGTSGHYVLVAEQPDFITRRFLDRTAYFHPLWTHVALKYNNVLMVTGAPDAGAEGVVGRLTMFLRYSW